MVVLLCFSDGQPTLDDRLQRVLDAPHLRLGGHAGQQPREVRVLHPRHDVLPAVSAQQQRADAGLLLARVAPAGDGDEMARVGGCLCLQDPVHRAHELDQVVHRLLLLAHREAVVLLRPLDLVEHRVLHFLHPVELEDVLPQRRQVVFRLDAALVVQLREQLDQARQRQHGPRALAQHRARHLVRVRDLDVARRHAAADHRLDAAEQFLVLQLFVAEPHQRLERDLVTEPVTAGDLENLGTDEALDETEHVRVRASLHLRQQAALRARQESELVDHREAVRQEGLREVEIAAADHVGVDVPARAL
jgi:hypothetical protein